MTTRFGVNYVPAKNWWHSWIDWDPASIAADLEAIAGLGADHIRIHLVWPVFQPDERHVSPAMLGRVAELMEIADAQDLDVSVTVLDGWLSGTCFRPFWQRPGMNLFADPDALRAQKALLAAVIDAVGAHPRFLGIDVGNEPNVLLQFDDNAGTTPAEADAWTGDMLAECERLAPDGLHVVGFDHLPWLGETPFGRNAIATTGAATAIHSWTRFTGTLERYGVSGTGTVHLAEYVIELARAFHVDPGRPVWLQEYGASPEWMDEERIPDHVEAFTRAALSSDGLWGITWWCSHDIDRRFAGFPELEYDLGLLTVGNRVKPVGERLRELIAAHRSDPVVPAARTTGLILDEGRVPDLVFADAFFSLIDAGLHPAIVRAERSDDGAYLASRGIAELVEA
jgi:endo-1,4-beta-mannosidase